MKLSRLPRPLLWLFLAVALLEAAFWNYSLGWLALGALIPFCRFLSSPTVVRWRPRGFILTVWLSGMVFYAGILSWLVLTNPHEWAKVGGWQVAAIEALALILVSLAHSLGWLAFALVALRFRGVRLYQPAALIVLPAAWVIGEYLRAWAVTGLLWGPETLAGPYWNFGSLGFAAGVSPLGFAGRLVGFYGIAYLVVAGAIAVWWLINRRRTLVATTVLVSLCLTSFLGYFLYRHPEGTTRRVDVVHIGRNFILPTGGLPAYTASHPATPADVLVLPEYSRLYTGETKKQTPTPEEALQRFAFPDGRGLIIAPGLTDESQAKAEGKIYYRDAQGRIVDAQDKSFLIPAGEYIPYLLRWVTNLSGGDYFLPDYEAARVHGRGTGRETPFRYGGVRYGTLSCSGILAPTLYEQMSREGAEVLVNSASLIIFKEAPQFYQQEKQMAHLHAVINAKPFVQAARTGQSFIIDANGKFLLQDDQELSILGRQIKTNRRITPASRFGEWTVPFSAALLLLWLARRRRA